MAGRGLAWQGSAGHDPAQQRFLILAVIGLAWQSRARRGKVWYPPDTSGGIQSNERHKKQMAKSSEKQVTIKLRGVTPLLMHRYGGEKVPRPKPPRGKKTQQWIDEYRQEKWLDACYHDGEKFYIPAENLDSMLAKGATKFRKGKDFQYSVQVDDFIVPLIVYSGLDDKVGRIATGPKEDWYKPEYVDLRGAVIGKIRIDACRPIFRQWGLKFTVTYDSQVVEESEIRQALERNSLGDYRPRFGRFVAEVE